MIYVFLAEGFEEIEAITTIDTIRRAEIDLKTVSVTESIEVNGAHGITVLTDTKISDINVDNAEAIVFPGGMPGTKNLDESDDIDKIIKQGVQKEIWIAAICAAPMILGKRELLKGKKATCFPGFEEYLKGAKVKTDDTVIDGKFITSRGAGTAFDFAYNIISALGKKQKAKELKKAMQYK